MVEEAFGHFSAQRPASPASEPLVLLALLRLSKCLQLLPEAIGELREQRPAVGLALALQAAAKHDLRQPVWSWDRKLEAVAAGCDILRLLAEAAEAGSADCDRLMNPG